MAGEYKEVFRKLLLAEIKDDAKLKKAEEECLAQVRKGVNTNIIAFLKEKGLISANKYEPLVRQYNKLLKEENKQTEEAVEPKAKNAIDIEGMSGMVLGPYPESPPTVQEGDTGRIKTLASKIKSAGKNIEDMDDALTIHKEPKEHTDTIDPDEIFGKSETPAKEYPRTVAPSTVSSAKEAAPARHKEIFDKNRYKYVKEIGKGGMGVVELYKDKKFGIDVAVKHVLSEDITPQRKNRFGREMRLQGRFAGNPHVVRALDLGYDEKNDLYFVMEFVRGKTLKDKIEEIDAEKVKDNYLLMSWLDLFTKIVETVGKVHDKDIIHRDIKPDNVMILDEYNYPKLMDFGLAKDLKEAKEILTGGIDLTKENLGRTGIFSTQEGTIAGTPIYMAPEQAEDSTKVDGRADIYALGAILYEILTGVAPDLGASVPNVMHKKTEDKIPPSKAMPLFKIPPALDAICLRALAKEKYKRYQTTEEFADDLRAFIHNEPLNPLTYKQPIAERIGRIIQKYPTRALGIGGAAFLTLASIVGGVIVYQNIQTEKAKADAMEARAEVAEKDKKEARTAQKLAETEKERADISRQLAENEKEREGLARKLAEKQRDAAQAEVMGQRESQTKLDSLKFLRQDENYYDAAVDMINEAIDAAPDYWRPYLFLAKHYATFGKHEKAEENFNRANEIFKKSSANSKYSVEIWFEAGMFYGLPIEIGGKGEENKALEYFEKAYAADPESAFGRLSNAAALIIHAQNDPSNAEKYIPKAVKLSKELLEDSIAKNIDASFLIRAWVLGAGIFSEAHNNIVFKKYCDLAGAKDALLHVIDEHKGNIGSRNFLASMYSFLGEYEKSLEIYEDLLRVMKTAFIYGNRGVCFYLSKNFEKAISDFTTAIQFDPNRPAFYANRGKAYADKGDLEQAIRDFDKAISIDPRRATTYYDRALAYKGKSDFVKAMDDLNTGIRLDPKDFRGYFLRADLYFFQKMFDKAVQDDTTVISLNPLYAEAYLNRGSAYLYLGNNEKAIQDLNKAIELNPDLSEAYISRGLVYCRSGDLEKGISDYDKAISLNQNNGQAYNNRGDAYLTMGRLVEAESDIKKSMSFDYDLAFVTWGELLMKKGDYKGAQKAFKEAYEKAPKRKQLIDKNMEELKKLSKK